MTIVIAKISPRLAESLQQPDDGAPLDVIVELAPPAIERPGQWASREGQIAARKATFATRAGSVTAAIERLGGKVTDAAWINSSLRARVAKTVVPALTQVAEVARLDLPRPIHTDANPST